MIRRISSLALGMAVMLAAAGAFAQEGGGDDTGGAAAPSGGEAAPAGGEAAPSGGEATPAPSGGGAAASSNASASASTSAASSGGDMKKNAIGADVGVLLPIGNLSDATGLMLGGVVKYERELSPKLGLTGRIGYFYGLSKSVGPISYGLSDLPVWVGARYYFMGGDQGVHAGAEVGLNYWMARVGGFSETVGGITISVPSSTASKAYFGLNIPVGYKIGDLDIQAQYSILDIGHAGDSMAVGLTVGYNFAKF